MTDERNDGKPRTWCLEPDYDGRDGDSDEIYWGYALNYDPGQGPLHIQANRVMVIEKFAFDQLAKERDELKGILNLKQDEYVRQVGEWKIIQRLEEERDSLRAEVERLKSKYDMQELVKRADKYKAALQEIAVEYTIKDYAEMQRPVLTRDLRDIARKVLEETT